MVVHLLLQVWRSDQVRYGTRLLAILLGVGMLWGCADDPTAPEVGESFTLAPGERITLAVTGTHVRFLRVAADSRCPLRVQCVWAGDGSVVFEMVPRDGEAVEHTLHTNEGPKAVVLGSYELTLLKLNPYPEVPGDITPEDYRAMLVLYEQPE
jgi:hypothetical protein